MIEFHGAAKHLDDIDLPRIGHEIGVGEDEIHAILDVESSGSGFDAEGRPKALYEPHVAWRNSSGVIRDRLVAKGLAYPNQGEKPYPRDSYPRILEAQAIDETVALKATSWGLGQILGENFKAAGYATVQEMVQACMDDEENHLEMMVRFLRANHLDDDLRNHQWVPLARGYNGPKYAMHNYDGRLAAAFEKWGRIKDTPFTLDDIRLSAARESDAHEKGLPPPAVVPIAIPAEVPQPAPAAPVVPAAPSPAPKPAAAPVAEVGWFEHLLGVLRSGKK